MKLIFVEILSILLLCYNLKNGYGEDVNSNNKNKTARLFGSLFGLTSPCNGCPPHFCDDDPAIIYGYCCGCAQFYEYLPVRCTPNIQCPLNGYELCQRYDYMMRCCCGR